jgi:integrase
MSSPEQLQPHPEGFRVRLRYGKGLRARFLIRLRDEAEAERRAAGLRELAAMLGRAGHTAEAPLILKRAAGTPSEREFREAVKIATELCGDKGKPKAKRAVVRFAQLAEQWTSGALARAYPDHVQAKKTAEQDAGRLEVINGVSIAPGLTFGALPVDAVTLAHCKAVMANLPKRAKRPGTRRHYAQLLHRVLELAVYPCELIAANPLPRSFMPKIGKPPAFPYLYPDEDAQLLACADVPLRYRMLWGFLAREGCRTGEAAVMRLGYELDLDRGVCKLDANKTDDPRAWALDPAVTRALAAYANLRGLKDGELLFEADELFDNNKLAALVRGHLLEAGVERDELHVDGENRRRFRAHDLRGTFVTLSLADGKTETWVADRTGHKSSSMINRYRRAARSAAELGLGPLAPLDAAVPELAARIEGGPEGGPEARSARQPDQPNPHETSQPSARAQRLPRRISVPTPLSVKISSNKAWRRRPSMMCTFSTPAPTASSAQRTFGIIPPVITPCSIRRSASVESSELKRSPSAFFTPSTSVINISLAAPSAPATAPAAVSALTLSERPSLSTAIGAITGMKPLAMSCSTIFAST